MSTLVKAYKHWWGEGEPEASDPVVSTDDMKVYLRIDGDAENDVVAALVSAATEYCEKYQARKFTNTQYAGNLDNLIVGEKYQLPFFPITEIDGVVAITDEGEEIEITDISYDLESGIVVINDLPSALSGYDLDPVIPAKIYFSAGHNENDPVPDTSILALKLLVGHWFEHREAASDGLEVKKVPIAAEALLDKCRVYV